MKILQEGRARQLASAVAPLIPGAEGTILGKELVSHWDPFDARTMAITQRSVPQLLLVALLGALVSCDRADRQRQKSTPQASLPAEKAPPPAPPPPWFSGRWRGTSSLRTLEPALLIDRRERNPKKSQRAIEGKQQEDPQTVGGQSISLMVDIGDDKAVSGEARVGSGDSSVLSVRGILDEEILRLALRGEMSAGTLVASRNEQGFDGLLRLSEVEKEGSLHPTTAFETKIQLSREVPPAKPSGASLSRPPGR